MTVHLDDSYYKSLEIRHMIIENLSCVVSKGLCLLLFSLSSEK